MNAALRQAQTPALRNGIGHWSAHLSDSDSESTVSPSHGMEDLDGIRKIPMWSFNADGVSLSSRVWVTVEVSQEGPDEESFLSEVVLRCRKLNVFASGEDIHQAERAFNEQIVHFYRFYSSLGPDQLSPAAATIQRLYQDYFIESASAE